MRDKISQIAERGLYLFFLLIYQIYHPVVMMLLRYWGNRGLHATTYGDIVIGSDKRRSLLRHDIVMRSLVPINIRNSTCLDLGCNDGFWLFNLGRMGTGRALGIDQDHRSIRKANFLKKIYGYQNLTFEKCDILTYLNARDMQRFDIILLMGILYHLPDTLDFENFFRKISTINNKYLIIDSRWFENDDYWYQKSGEQATIKGGSKKWRPKREDVIGLLRRSNYPEILEYDIKNKNGNIPEQYSTGDPYLLSNVADYASGNRSVIIASKESIQSDMNIDSFYYRY